MSIKSYVYTGSAVGDVGVERICDNCHHKWTAKITVSGIGKTESSSKHYDSNVARAAENQAKADMEQNKKYRARNIDEEVLCPKCEHFCVKAMGKHFRARDFATGILKKYRWQKWRCLLAILGCVLGVAVCVTVIIFSAIVLIADGKSREFGIALLFPSGVGCLFAFSYIIENVPESVRLFKDDQRVAEFLGYLSDSQARKLAVKCYKANRNTLKVGHLWTSELCREVDEMAMQL